MAKQPDTLVPCNEVRLSKEGTPPGGGVDRRCAGEGPVWSMLEPTGHFCIGSAAIPIMYIRVVAKYLFLRSKGISKYII
jgi:hypothetical protein